MARWNIARALEAIQILRARWLERAAALCEKLALGDQELTDWHDAAARIVTGLDLETGLYEQFAGYHQLEPLDLSLYADRKVPIDVVIGRERTQRSQVVKQADVVALLALLPDEFPGAAAKANFRYYEPRCAHGSSLSAGIHALVAAQLGETDIAMRFLRQAAAADLELDPEQCRRHTDRRAGGSLAGSRARLRRSRPYRRSDQPESSLATSLAQHVVFSALARARG